MASESLIHRCFSQPVIPVVWDPSEHREVLSRASSVIIEDGPLTDLPAIIDEFSKPPLNKLALLVHIDLIAGLKNNEIGLDYLAQFPRVDGVVTVQHRLAKSASRLGLLSIVRLFLLDSRSVERGISIITKSKPDAIELLPAVAAVKAADTFRAKPIPRLAGGLCQTEKGVHAALDAGYLAVSSTHTPLWEMNRAKA